MDYKFIKILRGVIEEKHKVLKTSATPAMIRDFDVTLKKLKTEFGAVEDNTLFRKDSGYYMVPNAKDIKTLKMWFRNNGFTNVDDGWYSNKNKLAITVDKARNGKLLVILMPAYDA